MRNTMAPSTALGMSASSPVRNITTSRTTADMVMLATWVRPLSSSRIWVLVGLPLTTNVPDRPAAKLAPDRPTMSWLTSTFCPWRMAKLREVAADCAMMRMKQEKAIATHWAVVDRSMPCGRPIGGKPPWTAPTTATPLLEASMAADTMIDRITATIAPGTTGRNFLKPRMMISVPPRRRRSASGSIPRFVISSHCCCSQLPAPFGIPSMSGN
jgi:hypothetical protein